MSKEPKDTKTEFEVFEMENKGSRLLYVEGFTEREVYKAIAKAQLLKTDAEWVAGGNKIFQPHCLCFPDGCSTSECTDYPCGSFQWQQLKKDMGVTE